MDTSHKPTVIRQISIGLLLIPLLGALVWMLLPELSEDVRPRVAFGSIILIALHLAAGIQRMLHRRFNSPQLIRGRTEAVCISVPEIYLANTVEQVLLASLAVLASSFLVPDFLLKLPLVGAILFVIGRAAYYVGYASHPMRRFTGFVLGHYSSLVLLGAGLYYAVVGS